MNQTQQLDLDCVGTPGDTMRVLVEGESVVIECEHDCMLLNAERATALRDWLNEVLA